MPMGLPTVVPDQVIASSHINSIADRVVGRFATTAERDTAIPVPVIGMVVTVAGALQVRTSTGWSAVQRGLGEAANRTTAIACAASTWTTVVSCVIPAMPAGRYLCFGILIGHATAICNGQTRIATHIGNSIEWEWEMNPINSHGARGKHTSTVLWPFTFPTAGTMTVNLAVNANMVGFNAWEETTSGFAYLGS